MAVEQPAAAGDGLLLLMHALSHVDAVGNAMGVGQDQGGAGEGFRLQEHPQGVLVAGSHRHAGHIGAAVGHCHQAQIFFGGGFAAARKLRHRTLGRGFGHLAAGVGVHLGVEHQQVDVVVAGEQVVDAAEANVVSPAISPHDPDTAFHQISAQLQQLPRPAIGVPELV